jgi:hypothetical protein
MSLGGADFNGIDPLEQAVNDLTASSGALFVIAAGNAGPGPQTLGSPGSADAALTVGAVDSVDSIASFSSRGPRIGDSALKPDITAPGVNITGARSSTGTFGNPGDSYVQLSGTSMATPHVAGAAAIALASHPGWTAAQLKAALMGSADPTLGGLDPFTQGAGRLNIGRGYAQTVLANPPSLSLGRQSAPHSDDPTLTRPVTYHNYGSTAVTLALSMLTQDPSGATAPAGMFSLNTSTLTVPAGGEATATFTAQTNLATTDGTYSGVITASGGGQRVETPFAEDAASATFTVSLNTIDRNGGAPFSWVTAFLSADGNSAFGIGNGGSSTASLQLPAGTYFMWTNIRNFDAQGNQQITVMAKQRLDLTASQTVTQDARIAARVHPTVPDPAAKPDQIELAARLTNVVPNKTTGISFLDTDGNDSIYSGQVDGPNSFVYGFSSKVQVGLVDPGPDGTIRNSPHKYTLGYFTDGQLPTGLTRNLGPADLATVISDYGAQFAGTVGFTGAEAEPPNSVLGDTSGRGTPIDLPRQQTDSFNVEGSVRWHSSFNEQDSTGAPVSSLLNSVTTYAGGSTTHETWNHPVYAPAFTTSISGQQWVTRTGDQIILGAPMFGDGKGHAGQPMTTESGQYTLKRNGTTIVDLPYTPSFTFAPFVPPDYSTYELDVSVHRSDPIVLSTDISAAWTFTSGTVDPHSFLPLQLWAATFNPALNVNNTAPKGTSFTIPMVVAAQPGSAAAGVRTVTVDYSTDDGATWQPATVTNSGGNFSARVTHPNITGFVSLRAHVDDFANNSVTETIIRAYRIG